MASSNELKGKRVLITGATDGIGLRLLERFKDGGAKLIATGSRPKSELPKNWPRKVTYVQADQSKRDTPRKLVKALTKHKWSTLDYLVLNAGVGLAISPEQETAMQIRHSFSVNLLSPILIVRALYPLLASEEPGKLTLIGSTARKGNQNFATYSAGKAGIHGFARALRSEWDGNMGVQFVDIGPVATGMHERAGMQHKWWHRLFLKPDFVADRLFELILEGKPAAKIDHADWIAQSLYSLVLPARRA